MEAALREARLTREAGITIIVAAVGDWINMREVRSGPILSAVPLHYRYP